MLSSDYESETESNIGSVLSAQDLSPLIYYKLKTLELVKRMNLVLNNTRELDRELCTR